MRGPGDGASGGNRGRPRVAVLGDLVVDVVLLPARELRSGTDVEGRVSFRQGGSAATTARVLSIGGLDVTFVTALGHDAAGEALADVLGTCGIAVHAAVVNGASTGRLGVLVEASGERTFVADRGAILRLAPGHLRRAWFADLALLHLPVYSLFGESLARASVRAVEWARQGAARLSLDLSSAGFLADFGLRETLGLVRELRPDVLFANRAEGDAVAGGTGEEIDAALLDLAPLVVVKEGSAGARVFGWRLPRQIAVPARAAVVRDSTGAGDAFDGGFLASWIANAYPDGSRPGDRRRLATAVRSGHAAARAEVTGRRRELEVLRRQAAGKRR